MYNEFDDDSDELAPWIRRQHRPVLGREMPYYERIALEKSVDAWSLARRRRQRIAVTGMLIGLSLALLGAVLSVL